MHSLQTAIGSVSHLATISGRSKGSASACTSLTLTLGGGERVLSNWCADSKDDHISDLETLPQPVCRSGIWSEYLPLRSPSKGPEIGVSDRCYTSVHILPRLRPILLDIIATCPNTLLLMSLHIVSPKDVSGKVFTQCLAHREQYTHRHAFTPY